MDIVAYCRVSTDKEDQLNSLEAQKEFFVEYARRTDNNLVEVYADEGISGTKTKNRKEFLRMMEDAKWHKFDMVVVKDISRLARNTVDFLTSMRTLKSYGIRLQFITANMDSMGESEFVLTMLGALAQEESANMSKRVKFGKKMNAEKGRVPNFVYGYDKTPGEYFTLTINLKEAAAVRCIFALYTKEGLGAGKIAQYLNEHGYKTKRGNKWSSQSVCNILRNEIYTGLVINGRSEVSDFLTGTRRQKEKDEWQIVRNESLRIIDDEIFAQAQQILQDRSDTFHLEKSRESNKYLFSTLIKCGECGWSFRRMVRTYKNTYVRWVCSGRNGNGVDSCPNKTAVDEDELIATLQNYFTDMLSQKKNVVPLVVGRFKKIFNEKYGKSMYRDELESLLGKLENERQKYINMYKREIITLDELDQATAGMLQEKEKLEQELKLLKRQESADDILEKVLNDTFKSLKDFVNVRELSNMQLRQIIDKIEVDQNGKVDIYIKPLEKIGLTETVRFCQDSAQGYYRKTAGIK